MTLLAAQRLDLLLLAALLLPLLTSGRFDEQICVDERGGSTSSEPGADVCVTFRNACNHTDVFNAAVAYPFGVNVWRTQGWIRLKPRTERKVCWKSDADAGYFLHVVLGKDGGRCDGENHAILPHFETNKFAFCVNMRREFDVFETFSDDEWRFFRRESTQPSALTATEADCGLLEGDGCFRRLTFHNMSAAATVEIGRDC